MSWRVWLRTPIIAGAALAATFGLFLVMHYMIMSDFRGMREASDPVRFDFVRLQDRQITPTERELPPKQERPQKPEMPDNPKMQAEDVDPNALSFSSATPFDLNLAGGGLAGDWASNREPVPVLRVTPAYPSRASRRGIEGWVEVSFTITSTGATDNVQVVAEDPPGVFGRAATKAVRKWKYKPQMVEGKVQPRPGIRVLLKFELEE